MLISEASVIRLLMVFLGAPPDADAVPSKPCVDASERERAGEALWDLTTSQPDLLAKHNVVGVAIACLPEEESRIGELAAGILANLRAVDPRIDDYFMICEDPFVLRELVRWVCTANEVTHLVPKLEFIAMQSTDLRLVIRSLECIVHRPYAFGPLDVWARAAAGALADNDIVELPSDTCDSGLDVVLRVLELAEPAPDARPGLAALLQNDDVVDLYAHRVNALLTNSW